MKEREDFEDFISKKTEGFSVKPPRSVWKDVEQEIQQPPSYGMKMPLLTLGAIMSMLLMVWFFQRFQNIQEIEGENYPVALNVNEKIVLGEKLFVNHCANCHGTLVSKLTGPALGGVTRKRSKEWLYEFTKNSQKMIASGDKDAVALWKEWQPVVMTSFPDLTDEELSNIFGYIDNINLNTQPRRKKGSNTYMVYENGDSVIYETGAFDIKIEGPVDSVLQNGALFHEEMDMPDGGFH
jgi:mono/diheme cytochrome c family protein